MTFILLLSFLFTLVFVAPAYAYLDIGSGTIILQSIVGAIAAVVVWLKYNWSRVKEAYQKIWSKKRD